LKHEEEGESKHAIRRAVDRNRALRVLSESEQKFRCLVEGAGVAIGISDKKGHFTYVNKALADLMGYSIPEMVGCPFKDLLHPDDRGRIMRLFLKAFLFRTQPQNFEFRAIRKDGQVLHLMSQPTRLTINGKTMGFQAIIINITERKKMEEALKRQRDIAITLLGAGNLIEALNRLFDNLLEIGEFDCAGFYLFDNDTGALDMIIHRGLPDGFVEKVGHLDADSPYTKVVMEGKPIYQKTSDFPPAIRKDLQSDGILAAAAIPIQYKGEIIGNLNMASHTHDEISSSTRQVLESVSAQIGEAIVRAKIEEKLRESEEKFRNLAEQSPNMIFINQKSRVVYANKRCEEITGYKKEEFYSPDFDFLTLSSPESTDLLKTNFSRHIKGEEVAPYEYRLITKEGKKIETILTTKLIRYKGESAILGILTDITHRKQMENELRLYSEHLEELVEERTKELKESQEQLLKSEKLATIGELATMVGHDLRNPLQAITNAVYILKNWATTVDSLFMHMSTRYKKVFNLMPKPLFSKINQEITKLTEERNETIHAIDESIKYANKIVSDLQDFARIPKPKLTEADLESLIQETLSDIPIPKNLKTTIRHDQRLSKLHADPNQIKRVFTNLATNAIQAMPNGGKLTISTSLKDGFTSIVFQDTGVGIPKEDMEKLFTPLFTTKAKGVGLGLAICKNLVEAHGGSIEVESEEGKGSTFTIKLPIQQ